MQFVYLLKQIRATLTGCVMKLRVLLLCLAILPTLAAAEIYKWKDSNGTIRYSDVPPPSNVKQEPMRGKKPPKPSGLAPLAPVEGNVTARQLIAIKQPQQNKKPQQKNLQPKSLKKKKSPLSKEEAAQKRAVDAEQQKENGRTAKKLN